MKKVYIIGLLLGILLLTTGCNNRSIGVDTIDMIKLENTFDMEEESKDADKVDIEVNIGSIHLKPSIDEMIKVKTKATVRGKDEEKCKEILDSIQVSIIKDKDEIEISTYSKDNPNMDFFRWGEKYYYGYEVNIDHVIEIPESIINYEINCDIGSISAESLVGTFDIKVDVGEINLKEMEFTGNSKVKTEVGSLKADIKGINGAKKLDFETSVGDVNLDIAKGLSYTLEQKGFMEKSSTEVVNGGETLINVGVSTGAINIKNY